MNRSELKLIRSLAILFRRHPVRDWSAVARLAGLNVPLPQLRAAIGKIIEIEAEERRQAIYDKFLEEMAAPTAPKSHKAKARPEGAKSTPAPKRSISGEEFAKWLEIISPGRPSKATQHRNPPQKSSRLR